MSNQIKKSDCDEDENLIQNCIEAIRAEQNGSVAFLQRRFRLGYTSEQDICCATCEGRAIGSGQTESRMVAGHFLKFSPRV